MTDCIATAATGLSAKMWAALDPRNGSPMTGQSARAIALQIARDSGLSQAELDVPAVTREPIASIAVTKA